MGILGNVIGMFGGDKREEKNRLGLLKGLGGESAAVLGEGTETAADVMTNLEDQSLIGNKLSQQAASGYSTGMYNFNPGSVATAQGSAVLPSDKQKKIDNSDIGILYKGPQKSKVGRGMHNIIPAAAPAKDEGSYAYTGLKHSIAGGFMKDIANKYDANRNFISTDNRQFMDSVIEIGPNNAFIKNPSNYANIAQRANDILNGLDVLPAAKSQSLTLESIGRVPVPRLKGADLFNTNNTFNDFTGGKPSGRAVWRGSKPGKRFKFSKT